MQIKKIKFSKKKGQVPESLIELIGAVLAVIIISLIVYVGLKISGVLLSGKDYDSTMKNFELLNNEVKTVLQDKNYANTKMLYYLGTDYILVGYNYNDPSVQMKTCSGFWKKEESFQESRKQIGSLCKGACLCIYKNTHSSDFDDDLQLPLKCISFDEKLVFIAPAEQNIFCSTETGWHPSAYAGYYSQQNRHKFLILNGFNTKEVYLDKFEAPDGNVFIFFAQYKDEINDPIYKRSQFMKGKYENT